MHYRATVWLTGEVGAILLSLGALAAALSFYRPMDWWWLQPALAIAAIRVLIWATRGPVPVLSPHSARVSGRDLARHETQVAVAFLAACFVFDWPFNLQTMAVFLVINALAQVGLAALARTVVQRCPVDLRGHRVLILGSGARARRLADIVLDSPELDAAVTGFVDIGGGRLWRYRDIPLVGSCDNLAELITGCHIDALMAGFEPNQSEHMAPALRTAEEMGIPVCVLPDLYASPGLTFRAQQFSSRSCLVMRRTDDSRLKAVSKSFLDRLGAMFGLVAALPLMALCAVMMKMESRGPIFFTQIRIGLNGRPFKLYKFRTMCKDAESRKRQLLAKNEMSGPVFKIKNDPRITRFGRFLRKYSLDELPQMVNVLRGDMALVGPRPPLPKEVARFEPWQRRKLSVKPGLTCLWQINGRNAVDFDEWMALDLKYIDSWSLWRDIRILFKTIPAVLRGTGM
jgi:exopolysaccharide biosynthesis polyprenyl glycosylphosphotransferase